VIGHLPTVDAFSEKVLSMMTALALLAALELAPRQTGDLTLKDVRFTYGVLGQKRADTKLLPGDTLIVAFDVEGITCDDQGKVLYSISTEVLDGSNKMVHRQPPRDLEAIHALGGNRLPAYAQVDVGLQQPAGEYTLKVTVGDRVSRKSQTLNQKFTVLPPDFGLVRISASADPTGTFPAGLLGAGQTIWVHALAVGFGWDKASKQPNVALQCRILDESGKPTTAKPFSGSVNKDVPANSMSLPIQFQMALNRPGKFTFEIKATDQVTNKAVTYSIPFTVHPGN
jgi:hypothetical protein